MNILITGTAGFIGFNVAKAFLKKKHFVIGIDNFDNYYSVKLKKKRNNYLKKFKNYKFYNIDISNYNKLKNKLKKERIDIIYHFAAQAGVRFTISNPDKYVKNNIVAFYNLVEFIKQKKIKRLYFASSSSVYGDQKKYPVKENFKLNEKNIYGFSKKINELTAKVYSNFCDTKFIGLRFFTVFGEWGRPDMLIFKYLKSIYEKKKFKLNADGKHFRDFTYIKDVIKIITKITKINPTEKFCVYNICSNKPVKVSRVINLINKQVKLKTYVNKINSKLLEKIEVNKTHGDNKKVLKKIKNVKFTNFDKALYQTVEWYLKNKIYKI